MKTYTTNQSPFLTKATALWNIQWDGADQLFNNTVFLSSRQEVPWCPGWCHEGMYGERSTTSTSTNETYVEYER